MGVVLTCYMSPLTGGDWAWGGPVDDSGAGHCAQRDAQSHRGQSVGLPALDQPAQER